MDGLGVLFLGAWRGAGASGALCLRDGEEPSRFGRDADVVSAPTDWVGS